MEFVFFSLFFFKLHMDIGHDSSVLDQGHCV